MISRNVSNLQPILEATKKLLKVALIGAPNAGKSTLLNRLVMSEISCVSNKVHTTRQNILGVYTENETQIEFYDSPGAVTRKHTLRHHLEDSLLNDPVVASDRCDLMAVVVDASNLRECKKFSRQISTMLNEHQEKKSFLILNKIDMVKAKRVLLDISTRLTEGHLDGKCVVGASELERMTIRNRQKYYKSSSPHVIELDKSKEMSDNLATIGYRHFNRVFSLSALYEDGVDELRAALMELAKPVEEWPHGPDYLSNQATADVVNSIIRGLVMDNVEHEIPYLVKYKYLQCSYDELGSYHINLELIVPKKYMIGKLLGKNGSIIFKITNEARERVQRQLGCDTKLCITVNTTER